MATKEQRSGGSTLEDGSFASAIAFAAADARAAAAVAAVSAVCVVTERRRAWRKIGSGGTVRDSGSTNVDTALLSNADAIKVRKGANKRLEEANEVSAERQRHKSSASLAHPAPICSSFLRGLTAPVAQTDPGALRRVGAKPLGCSALTGRRAAATSCNAAEAHGVGLSAAAVPPCGNPRRGKA